MIKFLRGLARREEGATTIEYGLMVALIAAACISILFFFAIILQFKFLTVASKILGI